MAGKDMHGGKVVVPRLFSYSLDGRLLRYPRLSKAARVAADVIDELFSLGYKPDMEGMLPAGRTIYFSDHTRVSAPELSRKDNPQEILRRFAEDRDKTGRAYIESSNGSPYFGITLVHGGREDDLYDLVSLSINPADFSAMQRELSGRSLFVQPLLRPLSLLAYIFSDTDYCSISAAYCKGYPRGEVPSSSPSGEDPCEGGEAGERSGSKDGFLYNLRDSIESKLDSF